MIFLFAVPAQARRVALLVGGSMEDHKQENMFLGDFEKFRDSLLKRSDPWEVKVLFDGGKNPIKGSKTATNANIESEIQQIVSTIKPGDEVVFYFNTHGFEHGLWVPDKKAHAVATETPGGFEMMVAQNAAQSIADKGAKALLVDLSCYSGVTQYAYTPNEQKLLAQQGKPQEPNYCIITQAASGYVSAGICAEKDRGQTGVFSELFVKLPDKPISAEDLFAQARAADEMAENFPQISSIDYPLSRYWGAVLRGLDPGGVRQYYLTLNDQDPGFNAEQDCAHSRKNFREGMANFLKDLKDIQRSMLEPELSVFENRVEDFLGSYQALKAEQDRVSRELAKVESWGFQTPFEYLNQMDVAKMRGFLEIINSGVDLDSISWMDNKLRQQTRAVQAAYAKNKTKWDKILEGYVGDRESLWLKYDQLQAQHQKVGVAVAKAERKLFEKHRRLTLSPKANNPCQNFSL